MTLQFVYKPTFHVIWTINICIHKTNSNERWLLFYSTAFSQANTTCNNVWKNYKNLLEVFQLKYMHLVNIINTTWGLRAADVTWNTDAVQLAQRGGAGRSLLQILHWASIKRSRGGIIECITATITLLVLTECHHWLNIIEYITMILFKFFEGQISHFATINFHYALLLYKQCGLNLYAPPFQVALHFNLKLKN